MKNFKTKSNRLSNETLVILAIRIIESVNKSGLDAIKAGKYFMRLVVAVNHYMETIGTDLKQQFSKEIELLFNQRKLLFEEIYVYLQGLQKSPDAQVQQAAKLLFEVVSRFGGSYYRVKVADQSLRYIRIIETLKKPEFTDALVKTLLTDKLAVIDTAQIEYENLYMNRGNSQTFSIAATGLRIVIENEMKLFYDELNWAITNNETEELLMLLQIVDKRMAEIQPTVKIAVKPVETANKDVKTETAA